jgi:hypothetical protein
MARPPTYTIEFIEQLADKLEQWIADPKNFWLGDFASDNGLWRQRLDEFADKSEKFSDALKRAKTIQESRIVQGAMAGILNSTMAIFSLKNVAGWRDVQETESKTNITFTGFDKLKDEDLDALIEKLKDSTSQSSSGKAKANTAKPAKVRPSAPKATASK